MIDTNHQGWTSHLIPPPKMVHHWQSSSWIKVDSVVNGVLSYSNCNCRVTKLPGVILSSSRREQAVPSEAAGKQRKLTNRLCILLNQEVIGSKRQNKRLSTYLIIVMLLLRQIHRITGDKSLSEHCWKTNGCRYLLHLFRGTKDNRWATERGVGVLTIGFDS